MTEHTNIPVPPEGDEPKKRDSLVERASGMFGLSGGKGGFKTAPMPDVLPDRPKKRGQGKVATPVATPVDAAPAVAAAIPQAPAETVQAAAPAAPAKPVLPRIEFTGQPLKIDRDLLRKQGMIVPGAQVSALFEEFRIVKRELLLAARDPQDGIAPERAQFVLISSPLPGEGKTFCATNLAIAMAAEKDIEVVLVDADFAKPSILSTLGLPRGPGLMDALADGDMPIEDCVMTTDIPGLYVLPTGNQTNSDSEYLSSTKSKAVLSRLVQGAPNRIVIFDSPPALAASPAAELAKFVGQAVLVARADSTGQSALEDALHLLSNCPDIKLLLNAANFSPSGRRFGAYYGYSGE